MIRYFALLLLIAFCEELFPAGDSECGALESCTEYKADVHNLFSLQRGLGLYIVIVRAAIVCST